MRRKIPTSKHVLLVVILVSLPLAFSCAGPELKVEPVQLTANPADDVAAFEKALSDARSERLDLLSPGWFAKAENSLVETKRFLSKGGSVEEISEGLSRGHAELKRAVDVARAARAAIPDALEARRLARASGAAAFEGEYAAVERDFKDLTRAVEDNNLKYAQRNQKNVAAAFHALEIRAIKEHTLGKVRELLKRAEEEGAARHAPALLDEARKELEGTDAFISTNPYAAEEMQSRAVSARFKAARLIELVRQTKKIKEMKPLDIAIWMEGGLKQAADGLGAADLRDQPFDTQLNHILGSITSLVKDRDFLLDRTNVLKSEIEEGRNRCAADHDTLQAQYDTEIEGLMTKLAVLEGKSRSEAERLKRLEAEKRAERERLEADRRAAEAKLTAERRFNELYSEVSGLFNPEEAEVYKQGLQLVLRLRSMSFPVGQAVILPENYALLSKVQRAIRTFGEPDVIIEGHTDSTGSAELNELLSQQRADAVSQYLLANGTVRKRQVAARGYGASKPLAPNTTVEGRAVNRRIDVLVTPASVNAP